MAKRVFFSFHYEDVESFRANVVRRHGLTKDLESAGFYDASIWEEAERHGSTAVKRLINSGLENTSVTCVLIGSQTWSRRWVRYEILKSFDRNNRLFGVHINGIPDKNRQTFPQGPNPFSNVGFVISPDGKKRTHYEWANGNWQEFVDLPPSDTSYGREHWGKGFTLASWVPCFDWTSGDGYQNFAAWVEAAK